MKHKGINYLQPISPTDERPEPRLREQITFCLVRSPTCHTCFCLDLHPADPFTHGNKRVVVFLQALVRLLVQSGKSPELCPIKFLTLGVKDDSKGGHYAVEVRLLTTSPPKGEPKQCERWEMVFYSQFHVNQVCEVKSTSVVSPCSTSLRQP